MSNRNFNYNKQYNNNNKNVKESTLETKVLEEIKEVKESTLVSNVVEESKDVEESTENEKVLYVVTNCERLNIRKEPSKNSEVLCVVNKGTKLIENNTNHTNSWFSVCTEEGIKGYCMNNYVEKLN